MTRLGENLEHAGAISAEPLERTVVAIADMVEEAGRHQVQAITAVGTLFMLTIGREDLGDSA